MESMMTYVFPDTKHSGRIEVTMYSDAPGSVYVTRGNPHYKDYNRITTRAAQEAVEKGVWKRSYKLWNDPRLLVEM